MVPKNFCIFRRINNGINQPIESFLRLNCNSTYNFPLIKWWTAKQMLEIQLSAPISRHFEEITGFVQLTFGEMTNKFTSTKTSIGEFCFERITTLIGHEMRVTENLPVCGINTLV